MGDLTGGKKAAATIKKNNPTFYKEIGSKGGKKTAGTFKTIKGFAAKAGRLSGLKRGINKLTAEIANLENQLNDARKLKEDHNASYLELQIAEKREELALKQADYDGTAAVDLGNGAIVNYEPTDERGKK